MEKQEIYKLWEEARAKRRTFAMHSGKKPYDMIEEECYLEHGDSVPLIRFTAYRELPFVNAAFSTRFGGVSEGYLGELNLGFGRGESDENVARNYRLFCESMGVAAEGLVLSDQVHDTVLHVAERTDACTERIAKKLRGIDGLITSEPGLCLATSYADCVPVLLADRRQKIIASSHAGWRGTAAEIGRKTAEELEKQFGTRSEDLVAVIGPSICQECYEVSEDVIEALQGHYTDEEMEQIAYRSETEEGKYQLDLWAANAIQLKKAGLLPEHIHVAGLCTCCNPKLFYSHRASEGKRGNLNGFISIVD